MTTPPAFRTKLFSAALDNAMQENGVNQVVLSARTGIAVSRINNYLQGKYRTVKPAHVAAVVGALGGPEACAVLIEAYLLDLLPEGCRGLIEVRAPGLAARGRWSLPTKGLAQEFAGEFADLYRLCVTSVKIRQRTSDWIELMREVSA